MDACSSTANKASALAAALNKLERIAVAFSGGVDSTYLLHLAHTLNPSKVVALTASSPAYPKRETDFARRFAEENGIKHVVLPTEELENEGYAANPTTRCYHCKTTLYGSMLKTAQSMGFRALLDGTNADDARDFRPGMKAADELGVISPLRDVGLTKQEIRDLSRARGLETWNKPAFPCLSTRFPFGERITEQKLSIVERAEDFLREFGFSQLRVRVHGNVARLELTPEEFPKILDPFVREKITAQLREFGFRYIAMDLDGYRYGSMAPIDKLQDRTSLSASEPASPGEARPRSRLAAPLPCVATDKLRDQATPSASDVSSTSGAS